MIKQYKIAKIPKSKNRYRTIYIPSDSYQSTLSSYIPEIEKILEKHDKLKINHAFVRDRSCVTNALMHIGYKYCLSIDIEDFFDSIREHHVSQFLDKKIIAHTFIKGAPRQGLSTSPIISNIAFINIDEEINNFISSLDNARYSRYADDLYFSFNDIAQKKMIKGFIYKTLRKHKFKVNHSKTRLQRAKNGNIVITGISISNSTIRPTRKTLRKIRAAIHQNNTKSLSGLIEWSLCKPPKMFR